MEQSLSHLEDPTNRHAMPSSAKSTHLMLPPTSRPFRPPTKPKKEVLEEEEYVEALSNIIERDYFPQLAAARNFQNKQPGDELSVTEFFERFTSYDNNSFEELQEQSSAEHKRKFHWLYELPDSDGGPRRQAGMLMLYYLGEHVLTGQQRAAMDAILDGAKEERVGDDRPGSVQSTRFRVRNQLMFPPELAASEDTCGMHERRGAATEEGRGAKRHRSALPQLGDGALEGVGLLTAGPGGPGGSAGPSGAVALNTADNNMAALQRAVVRYNKRATVEQPRSAKTIVRSNTNFAPDSASEGSLTAAQLLEWERSTRPNHRTHPLHPGLVLEAPHTPSLRSSDANSDAGSSSSGNPLRAYLPVPMSPMPVPGQGALGSLTPLFTWGSIEDSPLLLSHSQEREQVHHGAAAGLDGPDSGQQRQRIKELQARALREVEEGMPQFSLQPASRREQLGRRLDAATSARRSISTGTGRASSSQHTPGTAPGSSAGRSWLRSAGGGGGQGGATPLTVAGSVVSSRTGAVSAVSNNSTASRAQRLASLTPAARALAESLSKGRAVGAPLS